MSNSDLEKRKVKTKKKEENEKDVVNTSPTNVRVLVQKFDRAEQLNSEEFMEFGRVLNAVTTKSAHLWETYGTISNPSFTCVMEQREEKRGGEKKAEGTVDTEEREGEDTEEAERGGEKKEASERVKHEGRAEMAILAQCMRPFQGCWQKKHPLQQPKNEKDLGARTDMWKTIGLSMKRVLGRSYEESDLISLKNQVLRNSKGTTSWLRPFIHYAYRPIEPVELRQCSRVFSNVIINLTGNACPVSGTETTYYPVCTSIRYGNNKMFLFGVNIGVLHDGLEPPKLTTKWVSINGCVVYNSDSSYVVPPTRIPNSCALQFEEDTVSIRKTGADSMLISTVASCAFNKLLQMNLEEDSRALHPYSNGTSTRYGSQHLLQAKFDIGEKKIELSSQYSLDHEEVPPVLVPNAVYVDWNELWKIERL